MTALIALISGWLKHQIGRTIGVALVGLLLFSIPYTIFAKGHSVGYSKGYAKAIADRPTYANVGTVVNAPADEFKLLGVRLNVWKLKLKLGI
jgi:hypothetical protein